MKPNVIKLLRPDCHSHRSASVYLIFNTVFLRASSLCAVWRPQEKLWILNWKQTDCAINAALVIQIRFRFRLKKKLRKLRKRFHKLPTKETVNQLFLFPEGKSKRVCVNLRLSFPSLSEHLKSQCRNEMWLITFIASIIYEQWEISATKYIQYTQHRTALLG